MREKCQKRIASHPPPPIPLANPIPWSEPNVTLLEYSFCFFYFNCSSLSFSMVPLSLLASGHAVLLAANLRLMLAFPVSHILPGAGGIMPGIPPDIPVLGPNRI